MLEKFQEKKLIKHRFKQRTHSTQVVVAIRQVKFFSICFLLRGQIPYSPAVSIEEVGDLNTSNPRYFFTPNPQRGPRFPQSPIPDPQYVF
ncbi:MAG: hypothetical protein C6Y22_04470 [Hapalosiphonaceae cyanobacterium JJU2]|nr:MAG: hypothetical protein C6Y22_04470 [Hapalosiphonaceae cyanobacterium JJU2]